MKMDEDLKFDLRLVPRFLREGKLKQKDFEAYLKKLPDESENVEYINLEEPVEEESGLTFVSAIIKE